MGQRNGNHNQYYRNGLDYFTALYSLVCIYHTIIIANVCIISKGFLLYSSFACAICFKYIQCECSSFLFAICTNIKGCIWSILNGNIETTILWSFMPSKCFVLEVRLALGSRNLISLLALEKNVPCFGPNAFPQHTGDRKHNKYVPNYTLYILYRLYQQTISINLMEFIFLRKILYFCAC